MAEQKLETYSGSCHCGAFQFSVKLPELKEGFECNCSYCSKKGYLWALPSSDDLFVVEKGEGILKNYLFGKKNLHHKFCPTCGTAVMGQRQKESPSIGINVRTFSDFDEEKLEIKPFDGASLEPQYVLPKGSEVTDLDQHTKSYQGSCHCGKVTFNLQSKPLEDIELISCNCSICSRTGNLWLYPPKENVQLHGGENLSIYTFATKAAKHSFCSTCGVHVVNQFELPLGTVLESKKGKLPINVRAVNGIDLKALKVKKLDGKNFSL